MTTTACDICGRETAMLFRFEPKADTMATKQYQELDERALDFMRKDICLRCIDDFLKFKGRK